MTKRPSRKGPPDHRINPISKQFYRPYFSPHTNSYEMDMVKASKRNQFLWWMFVTNINTRFLMVVPLEQDEESNYNNITIALKHIQKTLPPSQKIRFLRSDDAAYFGKMVDETHKSKHRQIKGVLFADTDVAKPFLDFLESEGIRHYTSNSPFVNRTRILDRSVRTIRDMLGQDYTLMLDKNKVYEAVDKYNDTPHKAFNYQFTPAQVQANSDVEEYFIREQLYKLEDVKNKQAVAGFFKYKKGDILLVHRDNSKQQFDEYVKNRRIFNCLARFNRYVHGNVDCSVISMNTNTDEPKLNTIILPIYHTRFLAHSIYDVPNEYLKLIV